MGAASGCVIAGNRFKRTKLLHRACRLLRTISKLGLAIVMVAASLRSAHASPKTVGTTSDACDRHNAVTFQTRGGPANVSNDDKDHTFEMIGLIREFQWYCSGSRERVANDKQFNFVRIHRASNGAISWTFLLDNTASSFSRGLLRVGDSVDACDHKDPVSVTDANGIPVVIRPNQLKLVVLPHRTEALSWDCGHSHEAVRNPADFDEVEIERADNGAIQWVFFRTQRSSSVDTGAFMHLSRGTWRVAAPTEIAAGKESDFRARLFAAWDTARPALQKALNKDLKNNASTLFPGITIKQIDVTLPTSGALELRLLRDSTSVRIKLVVHDVKAVIEATIAGISAVENPAFDLDIIWTVPRSGTTQTLLVQALDVFAHHVIFTKPLISTNPFGIFTSILREIGNSLADHSLAGDLTATDVAGLVKMMNVLLATASAPGGSGQYTLGVDTAGDFLECIAASGTPKCTFRTDPKPTTARKTLDTSHDQCSQNTLWLWDDEKGAPVKIAKGASNVVVELANQR